MYYFTGMFFTHLNMLIVPSCNLRFSYCIRPRKLKGTLSFNLGIFAVYLRQAVNNKHFTQYRNHLPEKLVRASLLPLVSAMACRNCSRTVFSSEERCKVRCSAARRRSRRAWNSRWYATNFSTQHEWERIKLNYSVVHAHGICLAYRLQQQAVIILNNGPLSHLTLNQLTILYSHWQVMNQIYLFLLL